MWKILQINWSNVILKSSWSSSWIRFRPLTPSALPQIHKNSLKAPLKADNQSQWLIVHCLHPNDTIWSWTCSSISDLRNDLVCRRRQHVLPLLLTPELSTLTDLVLSLSADHEPSEVTGCRRSCQKQACSWRARSDAANVPQLQRKTECVTDRFYMSASGGETGAINWPGNVWPPPPSLLHMSINTCCSGNVTVCRRDHCVCVCVCVCVCHHVSQSGGWDHDMTQQVHMLKTWRVILLSKKFWAFPKGNLIWNFWLSILKSTWDSSANKQHKHF